MTTRAGRLTSRDDSTIIRLTEAGSQRRNLSGVELEGEPQ